MKSNVEQKPVPLSLGQKVPSMTDTIDCAMEASLADAQSCVLVATEGTQSWQRVIPDCWTVSHWPFPVIWHDSISHADTLTHTDLCLICKTVFIIMGKREAYRINRLEWKETQSGGNTEGIKMKAGWKKKRIATEIRECDEQRSNVALGAEIFALALGSSLSQQECQFFQVWPFCLLCVLLEVIIIWTDHLRI